MLKIKEAKYLKNYKIELTFNNNEIVIADLENELDGEIFTPLKNVNTFKTFFVDNETRTIAWPNGADFAPEFLLEIGKKTSLNSV